MLYYKFIYFKNFLIVVFSIIIEYLITIDCNRITTSHIFKHTKLTFIALIKLNIEVTAPESNK